MKVKDKNSFLIRLLCVVIILASFVFLFVRDLDTESKKNSYVVKFEQSMCPANGWVDCMPIVDEQRQFMCEEEFLTWAKENCANFSGAAL